MQTPPSQGTNSHLSRVEPRRFIYCAQRNSRSASVAFEPGTSVFAVERVTTGPTKRMGVILNMNATPLGQFCYISAKIQFL